MAVSARAFRPLVARDPGVSFDSDDVNRPGSELGDAPVNIQGVPLARSPTITPLDVMCTPFYQSRLVTTYPSISARDISNIETRLFLQL